MSNIAELAVLKRQIEELQDHVKDIDHGLSKKERNLRDEFAKAAMQSFILCDIPKVCPTDTLVGDYIARKAFDMADYMLKARAE